MMFTLRGEVVGPKAYDITDRLRQCYIKEGGPKF